MRKGRAGLYCPAPPVAGELTIEVLDDLVIMDGGVGYDVANTQTDVYKQCRWWLIGIPSVKLVKFNKTGTDLDDVKIDDIEESGIINADAKEELTIDTICGTVAQGAARAAFYYTDNTLRLLRNAIRASRADTLEQLLIGTMHSQFATPHIKLSGTCITPQRTASAMLLLSDPGYNDKKLLVVSETCNVINSESEIVAIELTEDNYTSA